MVCSTEFTSSTKLELTKLIVPFLSDTNLELRFQPEDTAQGLYLETHMMLDWITTNRLLEEHENDFHDLVSLYTSWRVNVSTEFLIFCSMLLNMHTYILR